MNSNKRILILENEIEARLLETILQERQIPHLIQSYHDTAYDGLFQLQKGWGHVAAPEEFEEEIRAIYEDMVNEAAKPSSNPEDQSES